MPCPDKKAARVYLTAAEYLVIETAAKRARLSISHYMREVCLVSQVKSFEHEDFKLELLKTRADLGRLGGLFKLALSDPDRIFENAKTETWTLKRDFRQILQEIERRQAEMKRLVAKL
ncbi:OriT-binding protein, TraJ [Deltaproteobacteria bacterium]|nr:OriT-binding protein, TraJ [Deltaproteobacteria bacterium]